MNERSFTSRPTPPRRAPRAKSAGSSAAPREGLSEAHRARILRAAEKLFSTQGFHGTSLKEIATEADVSVGSIYLHFTDKQDLFKSLLADLERTYLDPTQPLPQALRHLDLLDGLERLGEAAQETVRRFASYIRLIYVDVIEFQGAHVARLYGGMKARYQQVLGARIDGLKAEGKVSAADPLTAAMMASIVYMYYFTVENLFGVKNHYGQDDAAIIREFAKVFRLGILARAEGSTSGVAPAAGTAGPGASGT